MSGLDDLWGEPEPRPVRMKEKDEAMQGFAVTVGTVKGSKGSKMPVAINRDPCCWALHIGAQATFHPNLSSVFQAIAEFECTLKGVQDVDGIVAELKGVEDHIRQIGASLEGKIEDFLRKKFPDGPK